MVDFQTFPEFPKAQTPPQEASTEAAPTPAEQVPASAETAPTPVPTVPEAPIGSASDPAPASPAPAPTPELITPEQVSEIASEITEDVIEAITEEKNSPHQENNSAKENIPANTNASTTPLRESVKIVTSTPEIREAALRARIEKRESKLQRIMESARNRGTISNDDIEKILHTSDSTATRYARTLVERGNLIKTGKGPDTRYSLPV